MGSPRTYGVKIPPRFLAIQSTHINYDVVCLRVNHIHEWQGASISYIQIVAPQRFPIVHTKKKIVGPSSKPDIVGHRAPGNALKRGECVRVIDCL